MIDLPVPSLFFFTPSQNHLTELLGLISVMLEKTLRVLTGSFPLMLWKMQLENAR